MKLPHVQFTVRRLIVVVAVLAASISTAWLIWLSVRAW